MKIFGKFRKKVKRLKEKDGISQAEGKVCNRCGKCCLGFGFIADSISADMERFYNLHENTKVIFYEGHKYIRVFNRCKHLTKENLCDIYSERPIICRKGYNIVREGVIFPEGCVFK